MLIVVLVMLRVVLVMLSEVLVMSLFVSPAVECSAGLEYSDTMPLCAATCSDPTGTDCSTPASAIPGEGCVCPGGTLISGDECVAPENCGCMLDNDIYIKVNIHLILFVCNT